MEHVGGLGRPKVRGKEGEVEAWDLVEEFFSRIQCPQDEEEDEG